MNFKGIYTLILGIIAYNCLFSQQGSNDNISDLLKPIELMPPAPNAAALGQYGGIGFGLSSGAMSTSIPLYTYFSRNISIPITLTYRYDGLNVDELSSRTGVGWVLSAGGVINRTVYGALDENSTRLKPPSFSPLTRNLIDNFLEPVSYSEASGGYDAQPDRFAFNFGGYSGQFILDSSLHPILLSHSNLIIEDNYNSPNPTWDFRITTPDGVKYYFGGDSAREETDRDVVGPTCGHDMPDWAPTAFYLSKIVHPNNDSILLTYKHVGYTYTTGLSQSIFYSLGSSNSCFDQSYNTCPTLNNYISTCTTPLQTSGVVLKEISSTAGGKITFRYKRRRDVNLDSLVTSIEIYQPVSNTLIKVFDFAYIDAFSTFTANSFNGDSAFRYRHFLKSVAERSGDSTVIKNHSFEYNDITNLPRRLSFAQDHYGYYNGKNTNTSLIPKPVSLYEQVYFTSATADREANATYAKYGALSKITYPTGGCDTIIYEGNTINTQITVLPMLQSFNTSADSEDFPISSIGYSDTAVISFNQETKIGGSCEFYGTPSEEDPIHNKASIYLYDGSTLLYSKILLPGEYIQDNLNNIFNLSSGHSYWLKVVAHGTKVRGYASFDARIGNITYDTINKEIGGIRVAKVITRDSVKNADIVKKYHYSRLDNLEVSSGRQIYSSVYSKAHTIMSPCNRLLGDCNNNVCDYLALFSSSQTNLYTTSTQPVTYQYVTESFGDNFDNGGVEHEFTYEPDLPGEIKLNDGIVGSPLSNESIKNGREIYTHTFKKVNGSFVPLEKVYNHYKNDTRYSEIFSGYVINRKGSASCESTPPATYEDDIYDVERYSIFTNWAYVDTLRTLTFDNQGLSYLEQVMITEYSNEGHALPTKQSTYGSQQELNVVNSYYPQDLVLTGDEESARQTLISKQIISPILQTEVLKAGDTIYKTKTIYSLLPNGNILPISHYIKSRNNPFEKTIDFFKYNKYGKLLEQSKANDFKTAYLWNFTSMYPVAEVKNADSSSIAYTSFEDDEKGGWEFTGSIAVDATSPTGGRCYLVSGGNITRSSLTSKPYIISYWGKNGSLNINSVGPTRTGKTIGSWTYYEHEVTATYITVSGSNYIDELRLYPKGAQMITYTYSPLIGITSQCDAANKITYYEYDAFNRLKLIRDQDKNIIKSLDYRYNQAQNQ